jgi:hypothetical protein
MGEKSSLLAVILEQFERADGVLTAHQIADVVGKDTDVVSGMLETLVQIERLRVLDNADCDLCPLRAACTLSDPGATCYCLKS